MQNKTTLINFSEDLLFDAFPQFFENGLGFSTTKLCSSYMGPCIRVVNPDTFLETDIGFVMNNGRYWIDLDTAIAFKGASVDDLLVSRAYLQEFGGNGSKYYSPPTLGNALTLVMPSAVKPEESYVKKVADQYMDYFPLGEKDDLSKYQTYFDLHEDFMLNVSRIDNDGTGFYTFFGNSDHYSSERERPNIYFRLNSMENNILIAENTFSDGTYDIFQLQNGELPAGLKFSEMGADYLYNKFHSWYKYSKMEAYPTFEKIIKGMHAQKSYADDHNQSSYTSIRHESRFGGSSKTGTPYAANHQHSSKLILHSRNLSAPFNKMDADELPEIDAKIKTLFNLETEDTISV